MVLKLLSVMTPPSRPITGRSQPVVTVRSRSYATTQRRQRRELNQLCVLLFLVSATCFLSLFSIRPVDSFPLLLGGGKPSVKTTVANSRRRKLRSQRDQSWQFGTSFRVVTTTTTTSSSLNLRPPFYPQHPADDSSSTSLWYQQETSHRNLVGGEGDSLVLPPPHWTVAMLEKQQDQWLAFQQRPNQPQTSLTTHTERVMAPLRRISPQPYKLFCDLDGVLVDFQAGIRRLYPEHDYCHDPQRFHVDSLPRRSMWQRVQAAEAFFARLPWTEDGPRLWQALRPFQPDILTGVPQHRSSRWEKVWWCQQHLGVPVAHVDMAARAYRHARVPLSYSPAPALGSLEESPPPEQHIHVPPPVKKCQVITCWSSNKHYESGPNHVLIDDRQELQAAWEAKGGIFIHHTNVDDTLEQLHRRGVLSETEELPDVKDEETSATSGGSTSRLAC